MEGSETSRTPNTIKVLIVDDHQLFRDGLHKALETASDIQVIGQSTDGEAALIAARELQPHVVLLDINLPTLNGLQVARMLKTDHDHIAVVVLTAYHDTQQVLHAMRAGASAYCAKDVTPEELIKTVKSVADGFYIVDGKPMTDEEITTWISANVEAMTGSYMNDPNDYFVPLSPREMEILAFVTHGLSNKEIATRLGISQQTVKNHMTSILKKLNVQDRTQAAVTALRSGWVRIGDNNHSANNNPHRT